MTNDEILFQKIATDYLKKFVSKKEEKDEKLKFSFCFSNGLAGIAVGKVFVDVKNCQTISSVENSLNRACRIFYETNEDIENSVYVLFYPLSEDTIGRIINDYSPFKRFSYLIISIDALREKTKKSPKFRLCFRISRMHLVF